MCGYYNVDSYWTVVMPRHLTRKPCLNAYVRVEGPHPSPIPTQDSRHAVVAEPTHTFLRLFYT